MKIIAVGKVKDKYLRDEISSHNIEVIELADEKIPDNASNKVMGNIKNTEGDNILSKIDRDYVVALCIEGKPISDKWLDNIKSKNPTFIIGGSLGLSDKVKNRADEKISYSPMTFPHQLMRLMVAESISNR